MKENKEEWMREYVGVLPTSGKEYEELLLENFNNRNQMCVKLDRQVSELKEENQKLKSEQNKVAVEKLEELLNEYSVEYHLCDSAGGKYKCSIFAVNDIFITEQIRELKGEKQ